MLQIDQVLQDRYRIVNVSGHGGMGAVYEAREVTFHVPCVIKEMLSPNDPADVKPLADQFLREAKALAGLRHANLPRVTHYFAEAGNYYLVMDLVEWGNAEPNADLLNFNMNISDTTPVGKYSPGGDSFYGAADMAGNVWQWVADWYSETYYSQSPANNPQGSASGDSRVVSFQHARNALRLTRAGAPRFKR